MADNSFRLLVRYLGQISETDSAQDRTDTELLKRFVQNHDEAAFTTLVQRHGAMVLGVCRRVLHNEQDSEDVFQDTFLTLVRKATSIRNSASIANWLYGVARRLALKVRTRSARRRRYDVLVTKHRSEYAEPEPTWREFLEILDEEITRLPDKYRKPVVLFYLEGQTQEEIAHQLRWPIGTVRGRLARARDQLRHRLQRRGLVLSTGAVASMLFTYSASHAVVSHALRDATVQSAISAQAGFVRAGFIHLMSVMSLSKMRMFGAAVGVMSLLAVGSALFNHPVPAGTTHSSSRNRPIGTYPPAFVLAQDKLANDRADPLPAGAVARLGTTRFRHGDQVMSVAFSPDGKTLASAGRDHEIYHWDLRNGKQIGHFAGHREEVSCVVFTRTEKNSSREEAITFACGTWHRGNNCARLRMAVGSGRWLCQPTVTRSRHIPPTYRSVASTCGICAPARRHNP